MKPLTICVLLLAGCASVSRSAAPGPADDDRARAAQLTRELAGAEDELGQLQTAPAPRCERACPLLQNIRRLAQLICELEARHPEDPTLAGDCRDARLRAERARARVPPSCACQ